MNVILISEDPVALDTVYCYLVNLDPEVVPTNSQGCHMGIGTDKEEEIDIVLCDQNEAKTITKKELFDKYGNGTFDVGREKPKKTFLMKYSGFMTKLARRPVIDEDECVKCGVCVDHCPVPGKAVDFKNGKQQPPVYDYKKCIRCYCCQEMCPRHAISPKKGLLSFKKKKKAAKK
ncbi:MAG: 4Fe-4S binding protein, partial [Lachnospiraceae bacterium]|nr:4Fe-4S binding protein [Lachnospiraceae bacterium]